MPDAETQTHFKYLIIGGGMTADAAVQGIRELDPMGSIGMIGTDTHPPYNRPPLSKGLWKDKPEESIWRRSETHNVDIHTGRTVRDILADEHRVTFDQGTGCTYDRLLLATGGTTRRLPFGGEDIIYYRTLDDYHRLRTLTDHARQFAVIGGGFIGSEIAAALAMNGKQVTLVFPGDGIGSRIYPRDLSQFLNHFFREKGVQLIPGESVIGMESQNNGFTLNTKGGQKIPSEGVVAGLGITPNVDLAHSANLTVDNGIIVDEHLHTSRPEIYAAGDVANFYNPTLNTRMRVEHEDNANVMGKSAGRSMAGATDPYHYLPFFYSDLFELGYEAVGELDSRLETVSDWKEPFREGVVYYLRDGRVRGALLWNVWGQVDAARRIIADPGPFTPQNLKGRLPEKG